MQIKKDERNEIKSTSHSRYRCQYHIVFAPKYRRKEIYGQLKKDIGEILRTLCKQKNVEILEAEACIDHIHMLVSIPPYLSVESCKKASNSNAIPFEGCPSYPPVSSLRSIVLMSFFARSITSNASGFFAYCFSSLSIIFAFSLFMLSPLI